MANTVDHIHLIVMGGTIDFIDPYYGYLNDKILKIERGVTDYLEHVACPRHKFSQVSVAHKDSRELNHSDRQACLKAIKNSPSDYILVTHGTFTMNTTGIFLKQHRSEFTGKTVILTGSMLPLWGFMTTDASYNLGFATASFRYLKPGIYISMNGENFDPAQVHKDLDNLSFEPTQS